MHKYSFLILCLFTIIVISESTPIPRIKVYPVPDNTSNKKQEVREKHKFGFKDSEESPEREESGEVVPSCVNCEINEIGNGTKNHNVVYIGGTTEELICNDETVLECDD